MFEIATPFLVYAFLAFLIERDWNKPRIIVLFILLYMTSIFTLGFLNFSNGNGISFGMIIPPIYISAIPYLIIIGMLKFRFGFKERRSNLQPSDLRKIIYYRSARKEFLILILIFTILNGIMFSNSSDDMAGLRFAFLLITGIILSFIISAIRYFLHVRKAPTIEL